MEYIITRKGRKLPSTAADAQDGSESKAATSTADFSTCVADVNAFQASLLDMHAMIGHEDSMAAADIQHVKDAAAAIMQQLPQ